MLLLIRLFHLILLTLCFLLSISSKFLLLNNAIQQTLNFLIILSFIFDLSKIQTYRYTFRQTYNQMEGSLLLSFGFLSPWKRHHCVFKDLEFQFTQQKENPRTGSVSTKDAQIIVPIDSTTTFSIKSQGLSIQAKADNAQTRIKWVRALTYIPKKEPDVVNVVDEINSIKEEISSIIEEVIKKSDAASAKRLKDLSYVLDMQISQIVTIGKKVKTLNKLNQNQGQLSFHSILNDDQLMDQFRDDNVVPQEVPMENSQTKLMSSYQPIKQKLFKQNPIFMRVFSSFTKEANRIQLPTQSSEKNIDLINILKGVIGIDTLNLEFPVTAYEPLSCLQKLAEEMMFEELLIQAHNSDDVAKRILLVMAFALSSYSMSRPRLDYRPVIGETYQFKTDRYRFISQQVSLNHSAFHCESEEYIVEGFIQNTTQFTGRSLQVIPKGFTHVTLKRHKQTISYNRCLKSIKNLVFGEATAVNTGELNFTNYQSQTGFLVLKSTSILFSDTNPTKVEGWVKSHGILRFVVDGSWNGFLTADDIKLKSKDKIWEGEDELSPQFYGFSSFTIDLNHLNLNEISFLPGTDSRFRPDIRAHQYGFMEQSEKQRSRIEQKQSLRAKVYAPLWFQPSIHQLTNTTFYKFNNKYWRQRNQKRWSTILDIF